MSWLSMHRLMRITILALAFVFVSPLEFQDGQAMSTLNVISKRKAHPPTGLWGGAGARYSQRHARNGSDVHVVIVDIQSGNWLLKPALNLKPVAPSSTAHRLKATVAINGGYFNHQNGSPLGYVVIDRRMVIDPSKNHALMKDPALSPSVLNAILNRSELRVLLDEDGHYSADVANHNQPIPKGKTLQHSIQAGPRLLPQMTMTREGFIRRNRSGQLIDVIRSSDRAARTAIGIMPNGKVLLVSVAGPEQGRGSPGLTLRELANLLKELGCQEAINLDGGNSSTMFVRFGSGNSQLPSGATVVGKHPETAVPTVVLLSRLK